jgi:hypothetical protein
MLLSPLSLRFFIVFCLQMELNVDNKRGILEILNDITFWVQNDYAGHLISSVILAPIRQRPDWETLKHHPFFTR